MNLNWIDKLKPKATRVYVIFFITIAAHAYDKASLDLLCNEFELAKFNSSKYIDGNGYKYKISFYVETKELILESFRFNSKEEAKHRYVDHPPIDIGYVTTEYHIKYDTYEINNKVRTRTYQCDGKLIDYRALGRWGWKSMSSSEYFVKLINKALHQRKIK